MIKIWKKMKAELPTLLLQANPMGQFTATERAKNALDAKKLFLKFDQDLSAAMKKANQAKDKPSAKKALLEVKRIIDDYKATTQKWASSGAAGRMGVARAVEQNLKALDDVVTDAISKYS